VTSSISAPVRFWSAGTSVSLSMLVPMAKGAASVNGSGRVNAS
jgi:hypothetical protein